MSLNLKAAENEAFKLIGLINKLFRRDLTAGELCRSAGKQLDSLYTDVADTNAQMFLDTATWALDIFEKESGITGAGSKPVEERRANLSAKWRGTGKLTLDLITKTVDAYIVGGAKVWFTGRIEIEFNLGVGENPNIEDMYKIIGDIKPAHLPLALKSSRILPEAAAFPCPLVLGPVFTTRICMTNYYTVNVPGQVLAVSGPVWAYARTRIGDDV